MAGRSIGRFLVSIDKIDTWLEQPSHGCRRPNKTTCEKVTEFPLIADDKLIATIMKGLSKLAVHSRKSLAPGTLCAEAFVHITIAQITHEGIHSVGPF